MSRILRRPMFRGGRVDSYNTGIASGLGDEGYADGGRVSAKIGGFFSGLFGRGKTTIPGVQNNPPLSNFALKQNVTPTTYPQMSLTDILGPGLPYSAIGLQGGLLLNAGVDLNEARKRGAFDGDMGLGESEVGVGPFFDPYNINLYKPEQQKIEREKLEKSVIQDNKKQPKSELDKLKEYYENLMKEKELEYKSQLGKNEKQVLTDEDSLTEEQIKKESKLYEKLLGGDDAKSQSIYDALLAAAPGFFKGRNLREAAPQVLESINKSGAFDKPRDIKQAAAQLAIQRRIAVETAKAKSDDQLTRLQQQLSAKDTVLNKLARIPGAQKGDYAGDLPRKPTPAEYSSLAPDKYFSIGNDIYVTIGQSVRDPKTGKLVRQTVKFSPLG